MFRRAEQIDERGKIEPALLSPNVLNVAYPHSVWLRHFAVVVCAD